MTGHLFLLNSQLYFTGEEIPEKPRVHTAGIRSSDKSNLLCLDYTIEQYPPSSCNDNPEFYCGCQRKMRDYTSSIASLRERATLVGNKDEVRNLVAIGCAPEHGKTATEGRNTR